ncbi:unnamed protein product [Vicia faba]|uniref:Uncharacterized protein n=1 Tax=Vicia faba TaxID=3906 RepID=A0AAV0Z462_VICFA|nr:unnamed protein product [Vicia faba]
MKKKLDEVKWLWAEYLYEILWSYHTIVHSTTKETPFRMVYGANTMISKEINTLLWIRVSFEDSINNEHLSSEADLLDEIINTTHVQEIASKQRIAQRST